MYFRTRPNRRLLPYRRKKILSSLLALLLAAEELECPKSGPITAWDGWGGGQWADWGQLEPDSESEDDKRYCQGPPECDGCSACGLSDYASSCEGSCCDEE